MINVIEAIDGQLITSWIVANANIVDGYVLSDMENDILKIAVVNRYNASPVALGFIRGFGLNRGAPPTHQTHVLKIPLKKKNWNFILPHALPVHDIPPK